MTNEDVFAAFIKEVGVQQLNTAWVLWMLGKIKAANALKQTINPEWLRATHRQFGDNEPPMYVD